MHRLRGAIATDDRAFWAIMGSDGRHALTSLPDTMRFDLGVAAIQSLRTDMFSAIIRSMDDMHCSKRCSKSAFPKDPMHLGLLAVDLCQAHNRKPCASMLRAWASAGGRIADRYGTMSSRESGATIGIHAFCKGMYEVCEAWKDLGGDIHAVDDQGWNSFQRAWWYGKPSITTMERWVKLGGDVHVVHHDRPYQGGLPCEHGNDHDITDAWVALGGNIAVHGLPDTRGNNKWLMKHITEWSRRTVPSRYGMHPRVQVAKGLVRMVTDPECRNQVGEMTRAAMRHPDGRSMAEAMVPYIQDPMIMATWIAAMPEG
jgi:hypothetical protein